MKNSDTDNVDIEALKAAASCQDLIDYFKGVIADRQARGEPVACFKCGHAKHDGECVNVAPQPQQQAGAASALKFAAQVVELYDDATMRDDYMIDSGDCAGILNALADYFTRFSPQPQQIPEGHNAIISKLLDRIDHEGCAPLDWPEYEAARAMLEAAPEPKEQT